MRRIPINVGPCCQVFFNLPRFVKQSPQIMCCPVAEPCSAASLKAVNAMLTASRTRAASKPIPLSLIGTTATPASELGYTTISAARQLDNTPGGAVTPATGVY